MISDIDIRDWDCRIGDARDSLEDMDGYAKMDVGVDPICSRTNLENFIDLVEKLLIQQKKQTAALFLPKIYAPQRGEGTE